MRAYKRQFIHKNTERAASLRYADFAAVLEVLRSFTTLIHLVMHTNISVQMRIAPMRRTLDLEIIRWHKIDGVHT
jgi:hypothetical protein